MFFYSFGITYYNRFILCLLADENITNLFHCFDAIIQLFDIFLVAYIILLTYGFVLIVSLASYDS